MIIFSLVFLHFTSAFVSNFVEQSDRNRYYSVISKSQDSVSFLLEDSLTSTVFGVEALDLLDKELPNASRVCASLNKRKPKKDDVYQWLILVAKLDCSSINLPPTLTTRLQKALEKPRFTSLYLSASATLALIQAGKLKEGEVDFSVLPATLDKLFDDAGFMRETPKEASGSAYKTAQTMLLITQLTSRFPKLKESLADAIEKLTTVMPELVKSGKKTAGQLVFQGSLTATVTVLSGIVEFADKFTLPSPALDMNAVNRLGKYIVANKYVENVTGSRMILLGVHYLSQNPYYQPIAVSIDNPSLDLTRDDGKRFTVALQSMDGEYIEAGSLGVTQVTDLSSGKKIAENVDLQRTKSGVYELNLREFIQEAGIYEVLLDLSHEEEKAGIKRQVRATTALPEVKAVLFDFNKRQGVSKVPESERKRLTYSKKGKKVKISLTGVREGRLEVTVKNMKPEQMVARFTRIGDCEIWEECTFNVIGTPKSRKYVWKLDLSKEPYSAKFSDGKYKVAVLVAGLLTNDPIMWNLGEVEVLMPVEDDSEKDYEPINDKNIYFHAREPIAHTFAPPPAQANSVLALVFTAIILAPLVGFLFFRDKVIGPSVVNVSQYGMFYQISLLLVVTLVVGYWLALNLLQAMNFAFFICITAFFFGYKTVKEINLVGGFK